MREKVIFATGGRPATARAGRGGREEQSGTDGQQENLECPQLKQEDVKYVWYSLPVMGMFVAVYIVASCVGSQHTATPVAEPGPRWPVTVGCHPSVPEATGVAFLARCVEDAAHFVVAESEHADVWVTTEDTGWRLAVDVHVLAGHFYTMEQGVSEQALRAVWSDGEELEGAPCCV